MFFTELDIKEMEKVRLKNGLDSLNLSFNIIESEITSEDLETFYFKISEKRTVNTFEIKAYFLEEGSEEIIYELVTCDLEDLLEVFYDREDIKESKNEMLYKVECRQILLDYIYNSMLSLIRKENARYYSSNKSLCVSLENDIERSLHDSPENCTHFLKVESESNRTIVEEYLGQELRPITSDLPYIYNYLSDLGINKNVIFRGVSKEVDFSNPKKITEELKEYIELFSKDTKKDYSEMDFFLELEVEDIIIIFNNKGEIDFIEDSYLIEIIKNN